MEAGSAFMHVCVRSCGCVQVHVDLSPNGQDREEKQLPSLLWFCPALDGVPGAPLSSLIHFLGMEGE